MPRVSAEEKEALKNREHRRFARVLERLGRKPDAVIDVGVRRGTPWLYKIYAAAKFVLVDPQKGGEKLMTDWPERDYVFVNKAAGRAPGRMMLNEQGAMSTFLERTELTRVRTKRRYKAEITTLDNIIAEHLPDAERIGLKIDTEGFELEVLAGLSEYTGRIDFVLTEASVLNRFKDSYNFSELVCELWSKGFRFYNILGNNKPAAPRVYDCLFFPKDDPAFDASERG